jgi:hypothetical protein
MGILQMDNSVLVVERKTEHPKKPKTKSDLSRIQEAWKGGFADELLKSNFLKYSTHF